MMFTQSSWAVSLQKILIMFKNTLGYFAIYQSFEHIAVFTWHSIQTEHKETNLCIKMQATIGKLFGGREL